MNNLNQNIETIHDFFFADNSPSHEDILVCYRENESLINDALLNAEGAIFEQALRIKSEYCLALGEIKDYRNLSAIISEVIELFDRVYQIDAKKFNNVFFEKLIFLRMSTRYELKDLEGAKLDLEKLLKYYPNNKVYLKWKTFLNNATKKSFISRLFGRLNGNVVILLISKNTTINN